MSPSPSIQSRVQQLALDLLAELNTIQNTLPETADHDRLLDRLTRALDQCLLELSRIRLWGPENRLPSSELWNTAGHLLSRGWLENQARTKPRGYAGDFEMLTWIYENRVCEDALGRLLDRYFQRQAAPQAVRNRMQMMADWIVELALGPAVAAGRPLHMAIVGSAFGLDVRDALLRIEPPARQRLHVTLLDLDPAAIEFARQELVRLFPEDRLTTASANLFRLAERPQIAEQLKPADLLFCPGLFDYLDDIEAAAMLRALYDRLAPGGRLTVFQFAPHNPTRAYMEWLGNWYLTYRNEAQLQALVQATGIGSESARFGAEPLGVDLFVELTRPL